MRVLLVDNDLHMESLCQHIRRLGIAEAIFSTDALTAIEAAKAGETDVIIINTVANWSTQKPAEADFAGVKNSPSFHRNGLLALAVIKRDYPKQRVIMLTSPASNADEFCHNHGAEALLEKVFSPEKLVEQILNPAT